jgi:hypothetical protein
LFSKDPLSLSSFAFAFPFFLFVFDAVISQLLIIVLLKQYVEKEGCQKVKSVSVL